MLEPPFRPSDRHRRNALWALEHVAGSRMTRRLAGRARDRVDQRLHDSLEGFEGHLEPVPRIEGVPAETFLAEYLEKGQPVVLSGAAKHWPALTRWSPQFFAERYGDEQIRLLQMGPEDVGHGKYDAEETTLREALARLDEGNRAYCRFLPTMMEYPELRADFDIDWLRARRGPLSGPGNFHLFIGGAGTETGIHSAVSANLFVQVHGIKRWHLYSPRWTWAFRPPMERAMYFTSAFDPDRPDYDAYPEARHLRGYTVELHPGDVLYNPPFWWHKVVNPTVSIGVGFRWFPPHVCFRESPTQWLLTYLSVNPPFWEGIRFKLDFTKIYTARWTR